MLKISYLALAAMLTPFSAHASDLPSFEFRGHTIGEDAAKTFPYFKIASADCYKPKPVHGHYVIDTSICTAQAEDMPCNQAKDGVEYQCDEIPLYANGKEVGGIPIDQLRYKIFDDKIYAVSMTFSSKDASRVRDVMTAKYGEPSRTINQPVQNLMGANFDNLVTEWDLSLIHI